jgi:hypothetical protein
MAERIPKVARGDSPPTIKRTGFAFDSKDAGEGRLGGPSTTIWPFEPPIPEPDKAMSDLPVLDRHPRGIGSVATFNRYFSHKIFGFGLLKLAFGGMVLCSSIKHTFNKAARNEAISKCLCKFVYHESILIECQYKVRTRDFPSRSRPRHLTNAQIIHQPHWPQSDPQRRYLQSQVISSTYTHE